MSRKIFGTTVTTPYSPQKVKEEVSLPSVTEADNGKVLTVVNGKWTVAEPPTGPGVTAVAYVVGSPVEFTIPSTAWDGTHCTVKAEGYQAGSDGLYIGLPANDDTVNTQRVVAAALTLPNYTFTEANTENNTPAYTTLTISAVEAPTEDIKIAVFGLEEVTA